MSTMLMLSRRLLLLSATLLFITASCGTTPKPKPKVVKSTPKKAKVPKAEMVLSVPTGWSKRADGPRMIIEGPDPKLHVVIVASTEADLKKAIAAAWKTVSPAYTKAPKDVITPPSARPPFETSLVAKYQLEADQVLHQAIAHRYKKLSYVLLLRGPLAELKKRAAQLREVLGSARPKGSQPPKLTAKDAKLPTAEQLKALEAFVEKTRSTLEVPAVEVALVHDGKLLMSTAAGFVDYGKKKKKITTKTHMMIGSITKSFTGLLIAKLVAAGKLAWNTPATELYKKFKLKKAEQTKAVQLAHLLCACTGVPRRDLPLLFEAEKHTPKTVLRDLAQMEFLTKFGETFQYSNQLVAAAGYIVAQKLGRGGNLNRRYAKLLAKHVLKPLGMKDTFVEMRQVKRRRRYALPHSETIKGEIVPLSLEQERFVTPYAPAGALWSTADDFAKLLMALTAKEPSKALPPKAQLDELWKKRVKVAAHATYGLGWMTRQYKGTPVHCHGGGTMGFRSYFAYIPAARAGYVILTNGSRGGALLGVMRSKIEAMLFGQQDKAAAKLAFIRTRIDAKLKKLGDEIGEAVPAKRLAALKGRYDGGELGQLRIRAKKGKAIFDTGALKMAFLPLKKAPKKESYIIVEPPLTGISFWVVEKDGKPELHFEPNSVHYVAKRK
jgi:CubicO group peptidase (beta-lactamase class C family)